MYPSEPTHTEELIEQIKSNTPKTTEIIKELIDNHDTTKILEGVRYYLNDSDIMHRIIYTYENDVKTPDTEATNNKVPTAWHKRLVDQKVAYLTGKPTTLTSVNEDDPNIERIEEILGNEFGDTLPELVKHASNKGKEYLHPYIDEEGEFDYIVIPAQESIPIYENSKRKELEAFIRYYDINDDIRKIELWDSEQVTYYEQINGEITLDMSIEGDNPQSHFFYGKNGYGWGKVPFIEFKNNEEAVSDLIFYKQLIDAFEIITSDVTNTLEDMQSIVWVLRGYEGTDLKEFNANVKRYKVVTLSDEQGSGFDAVRADVPTEAVDSHLNRLTRQIYEAGQGVNADHEKFGNATGVALKFLYSFLDMKANVLERKFDKSLRKFMWFVCEYIKIADNTTLNYKDYSFEFNKSMIMNETEQIDNVNSSQGIISDERLREVHPLIDDIKLEEQRMEKQENDYAKGLPDIGSEETEKKSSGAKGEGNIVDCPECGGTGKVLSKNTGKQVQCRECQGDGKVAKE